MHSDKRYWLCPLCPTKFKHYHGAVNHGLHKHNERITPIRSESADSYSEESSEDSEEVDVKKRKHYNLDYKIGAIDFYNENGRKVRTNLFFQ